MTENEKLFVEVARELKKLLDNKNTTVGMGEVSLRGYFPEALWNKLHFKAGVFLSNELEGQAAREGAKRSPLQVALREVTNCCDHKASEGDKDGDVFVHGWIPKDAWAIIKAAAGEGDAPAPVTTGGADSTIAALEARVAALEQVEKRSADVMREIAQEVVTDYLRDEGSWKDYLHDLVSKCVDDVLPASYPNCKPGYDALLKRVEHLEHEAEIERNVEIALSSIMDEAVIDAENYAVFHRKFQALLKYHDSFVETYLRDKGYVTEKYLSKRLLDLDDRTALQNIVEGSVIDIIEGSYKTPEEFAEFHRKFAALLKYHFGKLARSQP